MPNRDMAIAEIMQVATWFSTASDSSVVREIDMSTARGWSQQEWGAAWAQGKNIVIRDAGYTPSSFADVLSKDIGMHKHTHIDVQSE